MLEWAMPAERVLTGPVSEWLGRIPLDQARAWVRENSLALEAALDHPSLFPGTQRISAEDPEGEIKRRKRDLQFVIMAQRKLEGAGILTLPIKTARDHPTWGEDVDLLLIGGPPDLRKATSILKTLDYTPSKHDINAVKYIHPSNFHLELYPRITWKGGFPVVPSQSVWSRKQPWIIEGHELQRPSRTDEVTIDASTRVLRDHRLRLDAFLSIYRAFSEGLDQSSLDEAVDHGWSLQLGTLLEWSIRIANFIPDELKQSWNLPAPSAFIKQNLPYHKGWIKLMPIPQEQATETWLEFWPPILPRRLMFRIWMRKLFADALSFRRMRHVPRQTIQFCRHFTWHTFQYLKGR